METGLWLKTYRRQFSDIVLVSEGNIVQHTLNLAGAEVVCCDADFV